MSVHAHTTNRCTWIQTTFQSLGRLNTNKFVSLSTISSKIWMLIHHTLNSLQVKYLIEWNVINQQLLHIHNTLTPMNSSMFMLIIHFHWDLNQDHHLVTLTNLWTCSTIDLINLSKVFNTSNLITIQLHSQMVSNSKIKCIHMHRVNNHLLMPIV